ncbi:MAG TPA: nicotinate-nicotinamide nucleotide adenylyltransferase [Blastocatellia bacterium]|nr:nicotinate-nicotinamide nucleotide adenylyltransferase [Blastocatellia bacterium]
MRPTFDLPMERGSLKRIIEQVGAGGIPEISIIKRAKQSGPRLGVFPSSFNPTTIAHVELMGRATREFSLDETLALAGKANADKSDYECPLEDRLAMLVAAFAGDDRVSVGLSSHAYFTDMLDALRRAFPDREDFYFIVGFDTFERVIDREDRYTAKYHRVFRDRREALEYLFSQSHFIVAARAGAGYRHLRDLIEGEEVLRADRVHFLDLPVEIAERSATEVRSRLGEGLSIAGLVPEEVEEYINRRGLYR